MAKWFTCVALLILVVPTAIAAQRAVGVTVNGVVVDQTGAVLPGAQVQLQTPSKEAIQTATTNAEGQFQFGGVLNGRYAILATFEGFEPTTVQLSVANRPPAVMRITLPVAGIRQEVTVGDSPAEVRADAASNVDSSTIDQRALENLPIFNEDVVGTMSRFLDSAAVGTNGVMLIVNGVEVNSLTLPASAIQQIKINQDPYAPEYRQPGRGRIEIVSKPASQTYSGTASFIFRDAALDAKNAFAVTKPPEQRRIAEGFLGGPIQHSENNAFTLSLKDDAEDTQAQIVAVDPTGLVQANVANPYRHELASGTWTHQQGTKNTMAITASLDNQSQRNQGVGGTTLASAGVNWSFLEQDTIYNQQTVITPKLLHQIRVLAGNEYESWDSVNAAPRIVVLDAFTGGGAQNDHSRTEHHIQMTDVVSWSSGAHAVKAGFQVPDWSRRRFDDNTNTAGTFSFSSLAEYTAGRPYSFIEQVGNGHVVFLEKVLGLFGQDEWRVRPNVTLSAGVRYDWQNYFHDNNNVAPRASIAYAPTANGRTVIRAGAGLFYDRTGPGPIQDLLKYDGTHLLRYVVTDPSYPVPFASASSITAQPPSLVRLAPNVVIPSSLQFSVSVEQQLRKGTTASVTYTSIRGYNQFLSRDVNAPEPPTYSIRPDPTYSVIREIESGGVLRSDGLQLTVKGQIAPRATGSLQYTLSKAMNNTSGINWFPPNSYDLSLEYARADFDQRHRFDFLGTLNAGTWANLGAALALYSGRPYSILTGFDDFNTGTANARPAGVPRNSAEGPGYVDLDLRWSREIRLGGSSAAASATPTPMIVVGLDAFNVLNRVNYTRYIGTLTSPFFGQAVSAQAPRQLQLSARVKF